MARPQALFALFGTVAAALAACTPEAKVPEEPQAAPVYEGASIIRLDKGLVSVSVTMRNITDEASVRAYAGCVVAQYAVDQRYGSVRQVRTIIKKDGQEWHGDAVYLLSFDLSEDVNTIDAATAVAECVTLGIPTV